jgi:hypothetical protein
LKFHLALEPRERWNLDVEIIPLPDGEPVATRFVQRRFGEEVGRVRDSLAAWQLRVPQLRTAGDALGHSFGQSVSDLASLRMQSDGYGIGKLPAAGVPWFMTVFGRDTIITCLQTLLFGPELARTALEVLAELQAKEDDADIDAEPGKIVHEVRHGKAARTWHERYYGTLDATPLYLILLSEVWRWTDDASLVRDLTDAGLLRDPAEHGRSAYDADDVSVLRAFADLGRLAIPERALVEVGRIYAEGLDEIQRRLVEVFTLVDSHCWDDEHAQRFRSMFSAEVERFARDVRVIADYTQQRNLQRAVLHKIEEHGTEHAPATTSD